MKRVKYLCLVWCDVMQRAVKRLLPLTAEKSRFSHFPGNSRAPPSPPCARPRRRLKVTDGAGCHQCGRAVFLRPAPGEGQAGTAATQILPANDISLQSRSGANRSVHRAANGCQALPSPCQRLGGCRASEQLWLRRSCPQLSPGPSLRLLFPGIPPPLGALGGTRRLRGARR